METSPVLPAPTAPIQKPKPKPKPRIVPATGGSSFREDPEPVKKEESPEMFEMPHFDAHWEKLPKKVIYRILKQGIGIEGSVPLMVRASRVCKKWHEVVEENSSKLWTHLDLSAGRLKEKYRNDKKLESFLKRFENVREVKLSGWKNSVSSSTLRILATACPDLRSIGLASCFRLCNEDLKFIGENFTKLERIDLSNVSVSF